MVHRRTFVLLLLRKVKPDVFTFPVSSGPGCRVTEHGRFRGI